MRCSRPCLRRMPICFICTVDDGCWVNGLSQSKWQPMAQGSRKHSTQRLDKGAASSTSSTLMLKQSLTGGP